MAAPAIVKYANIMPVRNRLVTLPFDTVAPCTAYAFTAGDWVLYARATIKENKLAMQLLAGDGGWIPY